MRLRIVIACCGMTPLLVAAAEPVRLKPSSPWVVDYAENSCRLIRNFGEGKTKTTLAFESTVPGEMEMLAIGRPLETTLDEVAARLLPVQGESLQGHVAQTVTTEQPAILWGNVTLAPEAVALKRKEESREAVKHPDQRPAPVSLAVQAQEKAERQAFAAAATEIAIQTRRNRTVILETGSLGDAIKALDQCGEESLKDWGVDPQLEAKIVRPVWALNSREWLRANDYPKDMLSQGKESQVAVRLLVDASGRVTKCTSLSHYNEPEFNRITCDAITRRAKLEPAELADGTKVPSYFTQRVVFRMAN
ncbi:TonB family protein [Sphingomonas sp. F9_3S_D5_B_2]